jgi:outer membrane protein assembly factor BamB
MTSHYRLCALIAVLIRAAPAYAQADLNARLQAMRAATAAGEHAKAVAIADSLVAERPTHPSIVVRRAVTLAAAGRADDAVGDLRRLLRWDARFVQQAMRDSNLARLRGALGVNVDSLAAEEARPLTRGTVWATLSERDLVPEGTAWHQATRSFLVSSMNKYKILAVRPDGRVSERVAAGSNGLRSVVGIHVDAARGLLWATSNSRYDDPTDTTTSALYAFDAASGAFRRKVPVPAGSGATFLNDITTGADGTVFVTDTRGARVYVLRPGSNSLEPFTDAGPLSGPNGITISDDGRHLFIADDDHFQVVSLRDRQTWRIATPDSINAAWVDGLAFWRGSLIAHHPLAFWRVARYSLDPSFHYVTGREYIERNTPDARTSTTGEVVGNEYLYLGNTQLDRMNEKKIDAATMEPIRLYRVRLRD